MVYIEALHHNSSEWQRPEEYLPDRFNPESELYLTPSGKKRNPYSFVPFSGGKRICFGKTFAEMNLRYLATYMSQFFELEFADKKKFADKYPITTPFTKPVPLWVNLKLKKD